MIDNDKFEAVKEKLLTHLADYSKAIENSTYESIKSIETKRKLLDSFSDIMIKNDDYRRIMLEIWE